MVRNSRQSWEVGDKVNVGFLRDLTVVEKMPTPGDFAPDAYVLHKPVGVPGTAESLDRWYRFVPHKGIERRASLDDARRP